MTNVNEMSSDEISNVNVADLLGLEAEHYAALSKALKIKTPGESFENTGGLLNLIDSVQASSDDLAHISILSADTHPRVISNDESSESNDTPGYS